MTQEQYNTCFADWAQKTETRLAQLCDIYLPAHSQIGSCP